MALWIGLAALCLFASLAHPAPVALSTSDLRLVIDAESGATQALEIDGDNVLSKPGGLYVEDFAADSGAEPVRGRVTGAKGGSLVQSAEMDSLGLGVKTTYQVKHSAIQVHSYVRDLRRADRAIVLSYRLPIDAEGWNWGQDLVHSHRISLNPTDPSYQSCYRNAVSIGAGAEGCVGRYPFSALSSEKHGLSYAIRMDEPRVCLMQYRNDLRCYEISFSLGLSQATEKFPGQAEVSFILYRHEPSWGFRSAAQCYYDWFPEFFDVRVKRMGGWYCNTRDKALGAVPQAYDFNFAYHECWAGKAENVRPSNRMGIYTFHYTEPWFYWQLLPSEFFSDGKPTVAGGLEKLQHDMNPQNTELITRDGGSANMAAEVQGVSYDDFVRKQAVSVNNSLLWDAQGNPIGAVQPYPWGKGKYRARFPLNLDPDIPDGAGRFQNQWMFAPAYLKAQQLGCTMDGMYLDSHGVGSTERNFRKEHFRYVDIPLTFDTQTGRPCILNDFSAFEFCQWLAAEMRKQNRFLLVNYYHKQLFFNLIHWDAIGSEGYKRQEMLSRTLCYRKPYSDLVTAAAPKQLTPLYWREYLLYATFPGQLTTRRDVYQQIGSLVKREMAAGWEPITIATCSDKDILIERYGGHSDGQQHFWNLYYAVQNSADEPRSFRLPLESQHYLHGPEIAYDLVNDRSHPIYIHKDFGCIDMKLLGGETTLLAVGPPRDVALGFLQEAKEYWADVMRVETYANRDEVASSLQQLIAMIEDGESVTGVQDAVQRMRTLWDLHVAPHAHTAGLIEKAANILQGLEIHLKIKHKETAEAHAVLSGTAPGKIASVDWNIETPEGWKVESVAGTPLGTAAWKLTPPALQERPKAAYSSTFRIQARVQTTDAHVHLLDKKIVRFVSLVRGEQKQVLLSDDLEGEEPLKDWCWRSGGTDLTTGRGDTGLTARAARSAHQGFRIDNSEPSGTVGVRSPLFREFEPGDFVKASAYIRQTEGQGVSLYLQCWKNPKGPNYYTMVKTQPCEGTKDWEPVTIETAIPQGTTAISFEVYASRNQGVFDFDDVEFVIFGSQERASWLGAE